MALNYKAEKILLNVLEIFGPSILECLWTSFGSGISRLRSKKVIERQEEIQDVQCDLKAYDDVWSFVEQSLTLSSTQDMAVIKCHHRIVNVLTSIVEKDISLRKNCPKKLKYCIFLSNMDKNYLGVVQKFNRYLKSILSVFEEEKSKANALLYTEAVGLSGRLLNILINLSYHDHLVDHDALLQQLLQYTNHLPADAMAFVLESIKCPAFIYELLFQKNTKKI
ncbi:hypothetical protein BDF14DRAFT_1741706 [Spinellus fusiger]|nr:hypothetical protein BDF14DRAFT_1741706 [Spinellus fusiger]